MKLKKAYYMVGIAAIAFLSAALVVSTADRCHAEQGETYVLGEIGDVTVSEGELLDFKLKAPENLGPDVTWTVTGLPEEGLFYEVPAFPGAEGFGAKTSGGRGGKVVKVTNLNRSGEGSLAAALALEEPRIIVFDVSGVIEGSLPAGEWMESKAARFYVANAPVTIAGQTAPGAGITLNGQLVLFDEDGGEATDNAIVRFLRLRSPYHRGSSGDNVLAGGNRVVFDHVSGAWGNDENFDFSNLSNSTFQWSGVEEAAGYGGHWEVYTDKDADGMYDTWEKKVRDHSSTDQIKDYILDVKPNDDLDGDGVTNLKEFQNGTNPLLADAPVDPEWIPNYDSDGDGLADWWEKMAISESDELFSLADVRPEDDLDGDLSTNLEEHEAGTTPLSGPKHNFGMIIGYEGKNFSLHHNFFTHHKIRTPLSGVNILDHRNNVIYNCGIGIDWHPPTMNRQEPGELFKTNIIGNYFKPGPNEPKRQDIPTYFDPFIGHPYSMIFSDGNYFDMIDEPSGYLDIFDPDRRRGLYGGSIEQKKEIVYSVPEITTHTAEEAYGLVLAHAGCLPRDSVTRRNVNEIITGTGKWGKETPRGGLMEGLHPADPPMDTDNDGMPDEWETASFQLPNGSIVDRKRILNPANGEDYNRIVKGGESVLMYDGAAVAGTVDRYKGFTFIEYYIHEKADQLILKSLKEAGYDETDLPGYDRQPTPVFSWTPSYSQAGEYQIQIKGSDGIHEISETVTIAVSETNRSPYFYTSMYKEDGSIVSTHLKNFIEVGEHFKFEFYVSDIDNDPFDLTVENKPPGAEIRETGRTRSDLKGTDVFDVWTFEWTPKVEDAGWTGTVNLTITDIEGAADSNSFSLEVTESTKPLYTITVQDAPNGTITPTGKITVQEGTDRVFSLIPEPEYAVIDIIVDGVSTGSEGVGTYIFDDISQNHTIKAVFDKNVDIIGDLILKLDFNGDMQDGSGLGNHGSSGNSSPTPAPDRFGSANGAYAFDGIDDYIRVPDSPYFDSFEHTLTAWIYARKNFYNEQYMISKNPSGGANSIGLYAVYDSIYTCGSGYPHTGTILSDKEKQWIHLSVVKKLDSVELFYNGIYQGAMETGYSEENDLDLFIGAKSGSPQPSGKYFDGIIDEVRLFNRALSQEEIAVVAGKGGDWVPLLGDINSDGKVDDADLDIVANAYGTKPGNPNWNSVADLNRDGIIDLTDLVSVASNFGATN